MKQRFSLIVLTFLLCSSQLHSMRMRAAKKILASVIVVTKKATTDDVHTKQSMDSSSEVHVKTQAKRFEVDKKVSFNTNTPWGLLSIIAIKLYYYCWGCADPATIQQTQYQCDHIAGECSIVIRNRTFDPMIDSDTSFIGPTTDYTPYYA